MHLVVVLAPHPKITYAQKINSTCTSFIAKINKLIKPLPGRGLVAEKSRAIFHLMIYLSVEALPYYTNFCLIL
ncbi:MAG: hypothetical protein DRG83_06785 [Deltaproteobacteria bacterium]|nr:MAG: hypothetical protein DRG83_06785 [Deltaproteobacteria bacterium]